MKADWSQLCPLCGGGGDEHCSLCQGAGIIDDSDARRYVPALRHQPRCPECGRRVRVRDGHDGRRPATYCDFCGKVDYS